MRRASFLELMLGLMLAVGCSGGGGDGGTGTTGGNGGNSCTNCAGCCSDAGCLPGTALSACGLGGASCVDCGSTSNSCTPNGPQPCECVGGCWDATLASCETGKTDAECGATFPTSIGTACQACRSGKHCTLTDQGDGQIYICQ
jgi:hypothetical protein